VQLTVPAGDFAAYLFDCDGTLADSMPIHYRAWRQAIEEHGGAFPEDVFYSLAGVPHARTVELINERFGYVLPVAAVVKRKEQLYDELAGTVQPIAAVVAQVEQSYGRIPLAVVSGGPRAGVERTLRTLGLLEKFSVLVCAEDSARGKPAPDPFLRAAELLRVEPARCLVFEDADGGIVAAEAAGMKWVRVPATRSHRSDEAARRELA
jgi:HAD superfamily hydrolase (TIGR01509 family)